MLQPRFSVITPVRDGIHNVPAYIECLQKQTFVDWEAIVVDDGSTDKTKELLIQLTAGDHRFLITSNTMPRKVSGPYQARNIGLNMARGEFICFLDIDDRWLPNKLTAQAAHLDRDPQLRLLYSTYIRARESATLGKIRKSPPVFGPQIWIRIANPVPMLTACVHRDTIGKLRFEPVHHEDYLFWHAIILRLQAKQVAEDQNALAVYYIHGTSISSNKLQATWWIWRCYRRLGYSVLLAAFAMLGRGLLQLLIVGRQMAGPSIDLEYRQRLTLAHEEDSGNINFAMEGKWLSALLRKIRG